jgi:hypothetical protein
LWPSGKKETFKDLPTDFIYTIVEDEGIKQKAPFANDSAKADPTGGAKSAGKK